MFSACVVQKYTVYTHLSHKNRYTETDTYNQVSKNNLKAILT